MAKTNDWHFRYLAVPQALVAACDRLALNASCTVFYYVIQCSSVMQGNQPSQCYCGNGRLGLLRWCYGSKNHKPNDARFEVGDYVGDISTTVPKFKTITPLRASDKYFYFYLFLLIKAKGHKGHLQIDKC